MSMKYGFFFYFLIFSFGFAENLDEKIEEFILDNPEVILKSLEKLSALLSFNEKYSSTSFIFFLHFKKCKFILYLLNFS